MRVTKLTNNERVASGFSHLVEIDYTDLNTTAGTSKTLALAGVTAGYLCRRVARRIVTNFDGGATSELTVKVGYDLASGTDDDDGLLAATSIHEDGTEVPFAQNDGQAAIIAALTSSGTTAQAEFNALRDAVAAAIKGGFLFTVAATINAIFTATGGNLTLLTQGRLQIFLDLVDLAALSPSYTAE